MVSAKWFCFALAFWSAVTLSAQTPLLQTSNPARQVEPVPVASVPSEPLIPEKRGDILMARKIIQNKIGIAYHQMLKMEIAKRYYERAIKIDPKYAEAINNLGTVYYSRKSYVRSIRFYKRALRLSPNSASVFSNLGTAYFARKDYKKASETYQKALSLDPEVFEHHSSWGVLLQERSVEERAKFHYYLAKTYAQAGMNDRALLYIRKALEEGFTQRKKLMEDPEFVSLRKLPEFQELLAMEPRVL
jgi:tetratricopeptide (TPR) repeat protein